MIHPNFSVRLVHGFIWWVTKTHTPSPTMQTLWLTKKKLWCTREKTTKNKDKRQSRNLLKVGHLFKVAKLHILDPKNVGEKCSEIIRPQYFFWVWETFWGSVTWRVASGLAREAVPSGALWLTGWGTGWWPRMEGLLLHHFETGCGGSKCVIKLSRWELRLERGDVGHLVLQGESHGSVCNCG